MFCKSVSWTRSTRWPIAWEDILTDVWNPDPNLEFSNGVANFKSHCRGTRLKSQARRRPPTLQAAGPDAVVFSRLDAIFSAVSSFLRVFTIDMITINNGVDIITMSHGFRRRSAAADVRGTRFDAGLIKEKKFLILFRFFFSSTFLSRGPERLRYPCERHRDRRRRRLCL